MAALFTVPSVLSKYLCEGDVTVARITYYKRVVTFELLVSCVLPLCVIAFTYIMTACHLVESSISISEGTQNPQLKTRRNTARLSWALLLFLCSATCLIKASGPIQFAPKKRTFFLQPLPVFFFNQSINYGTCI